MNHRARRRFSQNFLVDRAYIDRIVSAVAPSRDDHIVEIGPGLGALTEPLLDAACRIDVIEVDRDAARVLEGRFPGRNLTVHCTDFLTFDLASVGTDLRVVGNLPYHISTPILFAVDRCRDQVRDCTFMLQKEVVDRMIAAPASRDYGRLSVMLQCHWRIERLFDVPPSVSDAGLFYRIVEAAFSKRRKTLRNALREILTDADFEASGIDPGRRGETLSVAEFAMLADHAGKRFTSSSG
jgi:16S rRNA (adenine1518-N6/adenine1519-N6)-dimethyltransferase